MNGQHFKDGSGYYADPESECQSFHICAEDGQGGLSKYLKPETLKFLDCHLFYFTVKFEFSAKVQLPLPQRDPFRAAILYLRLVVQRRLLTGKPIAQLFLHKKSI